MFIRALGYYLSSAILVALSIDRCIVVGGIYINYVLPRYLTVSYPLSILQTSKQRKKARYGKSSNSLYINLEAGIFKRKLLIF